MNKFLQLQQLLSYTHFVIIKLKFTKHLINTSHAKEDIKYVTSDSCQCFLTSHSAPLPDRRSPSQAGQVDQIGRTGRKTEVKDIFKQARFKLFNSVCGAQVASQTAAYCPVAPSLTRQAISEAAGLTPGELPSR